MTATLREMAGALPAPANAARTLPAGSIVQIFLRTIQLDPLDAIHLPGKILQAVFRLLRNQTRTSALSPKTSEKDAALPSGFSLMVVAAVKRKIHANPGTKAYTDSSRLRRHEQPGQHAVRLCTRLPWVFRESPIELSRRYIGTHLRQSFHKRHIDVGMSSVAPQRDFRSIVCVPSIAVRSFRITSHRLSSISPVRDRTV